MHFWGTFKAIFMKTNKSTLPINVDWGNLCKNKPLVFDLQRN